LTLEIELDSTRADGTVEPFAFAPAEELQRGSGVIRGPHSFDFHLVATKKGHVYLWILDFTCSARRSPPFQ
jgi:hypothetical protein